VEHPFGTDFISGFCETLDWQIISTSKWLSGFVCEGSFCALEFFIMIWNASLMLLFVSCWFFMGFSFCVWSAIIDYSSHSAKAARTALRRIFVYLIKQILCNFYQSKPIFTGLQASTLTFFLTCPFGQLTKKSTFPTQSFSCPQKIYIYKNQRIIISNLCKMFWLLSHKHCLILSLLKLGHKVIGIKRCHHGMSV
jgi:hypothetical protein